MGSKSFTIFVFCVVMALAACQQKDKPAGSGQGGMLQMTMEQSDSVEVYDLVRSFMNSLKNCDVDGAMSQLVFLDGFDHIQPLPDSIALAQRNSLLSLQGFDYIIRRAVFHREKDNLITVNVILFEKADDDPRPNTISLGLRPVRVDEKWYITLADTNNERYTNHISDIQ